MIPTIESFWQGPDAEDRRKTHAKEYALHSSELEGAAAGLHPRICAVVTAYEAEHGPTLPGRYASGWRPKSVNDATANAGKTSAHLDASAGDVATEPDGEFAWWCMRNPHILAMHALYLEHPSATVLRAFATARQAGRAPTPWAHLTTRAPGSHLRVFHPDGASVTDWDAYLGEGGDPLGCGYAAWAALPLEGGARNAQADPGASRAGGGRATPTPRA